MDANYEKLCIDAGSDQESYDLAELHHPNWNTLNPVAQKFHARNVDIVKECDRVYACPSSKPWGGGTAMGIKIGLHLGKAVMVNDSVTGRTWDTCGCDEKA